MTRTADAVICGAGIAGAAAGHELVVRRRMRDVLVVDPLPPPSLTSDKSTECYRNWWPGPGDTMVRLMIRSIDLPEELEASSGGRLNLGRRGYAYVTAEPSRGDGVGAVGAPGALPGPGVPGPAPGDRSRPAPGGRPPPISGRCARTAGVARDSRGV